MGKIVLFWEKITDKYSASIKKISAWLDSMPESKLLLLLFLVSIILVFVTSQFIEKSGDAVYKWGILRYYVDFGKWYPVQVDHHQGRWAINIPVIGLMKIFGTSALVYYVFPFITGIIGSMLIYSVTSKLGTRLAGTAAFLIFAIFPLTTRESTQFLPMLPATMFILAAFYFILKWLDKKQLFYILLAGIMVILAYGCKVTSLYWALAFALFIAIYGPDKKTYFSLLKIKIGPALILFSLTILGGLLIETLLINHFCGLSYGRMQVIAGSHLHNRVDPQYCNFFVWLFSFLRPLSLRGKYFESIPCFFIFTLGMVSAVLCLLKGNINKKFLSFSLITVYLLHCYIVYRIFPFLHPEKPHSRYFMVVAAGCIIMYCVSRKEWNELIWNKISNIQLAQFLKTALCMAWLITSLIYVGNSWLRNGTIISAFTGEIMFFEAEEKKLPVLLELEKNPVDGKLRSSDRKSALRWLTLFGPSKLIPQLKNIPFPFVTDSHGKRYLALLSADRLTNSNGQDILTIDDLDLSIREKTMQTSKTTFRLDHEPKPER